MDPADAAYKQRQRQRVVHTQYQAPAIPTKYGCDGPCTQPPPTPPPLTEGFESPQAGWWTVMTVAAVSFAFLTIRPRLNKK
jgi:hypothetical protein